MIEALAPADVVHPRRRGARSRIRRACGRDRRALLLRPRGASGRPRLCARGRRPRGGRARRRAPARSTCRSSLSPDARARWRVAADAFFEHPTRELTVVGVTGTNGKTTTAFLLLRDAGRRDGDRAARNDRDGGSAASARPGLNDRRRRSTCSGSFREMLDAGDRSLRARGDLARRRRRAGSTARASRCSSSRT